MKKIINNALAIMICVLIIVASIIVGTPLKENTKPITNLSIIIFLIYIMLYKIMLKAKYRNLVKYINKIDIIILVLCLCPWIPIFFKTAVNIEDSTNIAIRYLGILIIYTTSRILFIQDKKYINYITKTLIFTGIISAIIGIDNMTYGNLTSTLYRLGVPKIINIENRMFGNFGYANTFALSLFVPLVLSANEFMKNKNYIYVGINFLLIVCILLTYSKAIYILVIFWMIAYSILQKDKKIRIMFISNILFQIILGIIYSKIFTKLQQTEKYLEIWVAIIVFISLSIGMTALLNKLLKIRDIKFKKFIILFITFVILAIIIGLNLRKTLIIFEKPEQTENVKYTISNIKPNTLYEFEFDIEAQTLTNKEIYIIKIDEENEYLKPVEYHYITVGTYTGKKYISFKTTKNTREISLFFKTTDPESQKGLKINSLKINGEEYVLEYMYLPANLVSRIKSLNFKNLSVTQRLTFYKDAFKLIQRNPWTGIGGNGWLYTYEDVKSYNYHSTQVHSYPIQIWLEFGIIALIIYGILIILLILYSRKNNCDIISVKISLSVILLHSAIDFNLSFMNILVYTFLLISIISSNRQRDN